MDIHLHIPVWALQILAGVGCAFLGGAIVLAMIWWEAGRSIMRGLNW